LPYIEEIWFTWLTIKGDPDLTLRQLHGKLGKVVRIGPNEVSIDDRDAVKDLYGHGNDIEKSMHLWHLANRYWASVAIEWTMFSSIMMFKLMAEQSLSRQEPTNDCSFIFSTIPDDDRIYSIMYTKVPTTNGTSCNVTRN